MSRIATLLLICYLHHPLDSDGNTRVQTKTGAQTTAAFAAARVLRAGRFAV